MNRTRALALVAAVAVLGTIVLARSIAPPGSPPEYPGARPEPAADGYVSHTESVFVAVSPAEYRTWVDAPGRELADIVVAAEGMSAVAATVNLRGDWDPAGDRSGDRRRVEFADGHHLAEEVLVDTAARFRYLIWGFTSYQRFAVRHAVAEFSYSPLPGGMRLTWTYSFRPTSALTRPFVAGFVEDTIAPMMRAARWTACGRAPSATCAERVQEDHVNLPGLTAAPGRAPR